MVFRTETSCSVAAWLCVHYVHVCMSSYARMCLHFMHFCHIQALGSFTLGGAVKQRS